MDANAAPFQPDNACDVLNLALQDAPPLGDEYGYGDLAVDLMTALREHGYAVVNAPPGQSRAAFLIQRWKDENLCVRCENLLTSPTPRCPANLPSRPSHRSMADLMGVCRHGCLGGECGGPAVPATPPVTSRSDEPATHCDQGDSCDRNT